MSARFEIRIGVSAEEMGREFVEAWRRAEAGEERKMRDILVFEDWSTFLATFSEARIALLNRLAEGPAASISALAGSLGRNYRRVHDDVAALEGAGILERTGNQVALAVDGVHASLDFRARSSASAEPDAR